MTPEELALIEAGASEDVADDVEDTSEEVDELLQLVKSGQERDTIWRTQLDERITTCSTRLEALSTGREAENPILTQLLNQMVEIRAEVALVKLSTDSLLTRPVQTQSESPVVEVVPENADVEDLPEAVENPPSKPTRKNRFI